MADYNGWTNYETWNIKLWIDNEQGSQEYWQEQAQAAWDESQRNPESRFRDAACDLADRLKGEFEEAMPDLGATCWADLLGAALSEVNWYEIAKNMLEDVDKETADE